MSTGGEPAESWTQALLKSYSRAVEKEKQFLLEATPNCSLIGNSELSCLSQFGLKFSILAAEIDKEVEES